MNHPDARAPARTLHNPVLPGFHPDPSILRVGRDFYVATSTFEWFPGVRLHHSRDLVHWTPIGHALTRPDQLDLLGAPRSGGVWAPCLSHHAGRFFLAYTDVKAWGHGYLDAHNCVVSANDVRGPWSRPTRLTSGGFDPSLFHDRDGRTWLVGMVWDHRPNAANRFNGIMLQEFSVAAGGLLGTPQRIFSGTELGCTEGPHLYFHDGFYYLIVAEGGTSYDHAVTVARAPTVEGPYQADPAGPLLTSRGDPSLALQKAGHASLVETPSGEWYIAHLCARPVGPARRCILGRETALQRVRWTADGWLRLDNAGGTAPALHVPAPRLTPAPTAPAPARDDFDRAELGAEYQTLRDPAHPSWVTLTERPGFLRLYGRESFRSLHRQSLVARRLPALRCRIETSFEYAPRNFQQSAGLALFYDDENFFFAFLGFDEHHGPCLGLYASALGETRDLLPAPIPCPSSRLTLRADLDAPALRFAFSLDGQDFEPLGPELDATVLSDEHTSLGLGFTGTFAALCTQDLSGARLPADFSYFDIVT